MNFDARAPWTRSLSLIACVVAFGAACGDDSTTKDAGDGGTATAHEDAAVGGSHDSSVPGVDAAMSPDASDADDAGGLMDAAASMDAAGESQDASSSAPAGSTTGNVTICPDGAACEPPCAQSQAAGIGNCMVFVNNRYSMLVMGNVTCGDAIALNFNEGTPAAGTFTVGGVNDYTAGKVAISHTGDSIEYATSGSVTVEVDGTKITATFEDVPFPSGTTVSAEITCH